MDSTQTAALQQQQQQQQIAASQAAAAAAASTSPQSLPSSRASPRSQSLSLDLSDLPPLITPSPPSNTLLITNLMDPSIFHPASLATIRENVSRTATLHSFSPLKSFRRIVASFYSTEDAVAIRRQLDGEDILGARVRVFFGAPTPVDLDERSRHLAAPHSDRLFFISPPPSPPHGWEVRNEEPPNKDVHADDLAAALAKLHSKTRGGVMSSSDERNNNNNSNDDEATALVSPISPARTTDSDTVPTGWAGAGAAPAGHQRMRSGSTTIVYHPEHHGGSPTLPAVMVEDTTEEYGDGVEDEGEEKKIMAHTARPPVELMES